VKKLSSIFVLLIFASAVFANGVSLNSPGARAIAMGGAYISIANDYSAPYWNPAGLVGINGMQAGLFITDIMPSATYKTENFPAAGINLDAKSKAMQVIAPNAAFLWKCKLNEKLHMGLSFLVPAGLAVEWDGADLAALSGGQTYDWKSSIGVFNISLTMAGQLTDKLNFGTAFHWVHGSMTMDKGVALPSAPTIYNGQYTEESSGSGFGFGTGIQYKCCPNMTFGLSMRTDMSVKFEGEAENPLVPVIAGSMGISAPSKSDFNRTISWPLWIGGGIAYNVTPKLLTAFELQWSNWTAFEQELVAEYDDPTFNTIMTNIQANTIHLKWKDATQIRLGLEYLLNSKMALRCGAYLDPAPGPDKTQTILIPNTDFTVVTGGIGFNPTEKIAIDLGAEYLMGKERDIELADVMINPATMQPIGMPGKHGLGILAVSVGLTYKF
jgi:long-chain fatty acid transport protein